MDAGPSTTETLLIALAGGAIGAVLASLAWIMLRLASIPGGLRKSDFAVRVLNEDLELWVADIYRDLKQELRGIANSQGQHIENGSHLNARSAAKTRMLHRWRDRLHSAERELVAIQAKETWVHRLWRYRPKYRNSLELTAIDRVEPIVAEFRRPVATPAGQTADVQDPTDLSLDDLLDEIARSPLT
jgi:hypothetical protein